MGRMLLVFRLAARDLRRRPAEAALLLVAIMAATTTLTIGLVLRAAASDPYQNTREATAGPDVVASVTPPLSGGQPADRSGLRALGNAPGVIGHSGPYPVAGAELEANGHTVDVEAEGRDTTTVQVDQPRLIDGSWVRDGGVVVEAALADALGIGAGDQVSLDGRSYRVAGVAVTAATEPYPEALDYTPPDPPAGATQFPPPSTDLGLVWLTKADARSLAGQPESLSYIMNLKLADPSAAQTFVETHGPSENAAPGGPSSDPATMEMEWLTTWQQTRDNVSLLVRNEQRVLVAAGWLLGLLAVASVAVLVGGRIADQTRRVGLLKAVGGTPGLVAAVLLAEYVVVALVAAAAGLAVGWLVAPLLTDPSAGLIGSTGTPSLDIATVGVVAAVALGVAVLATLVPAIRAARTSTVLALADAARPPRRTAWLIAISARLPAPLLLALRVAGRRPRRLILSIVSVAITVSGIVAALSLNAQLDTSRFAASAQLDDARTERLGQVLLIITVMLVALAAVNAIVTTWATVLDARYSSALARALGLTPQQVSIGLSAAQLLPAFAGAILGIPAGLVLTAAVDPDTTTNPPLWQLLTVVPGTVLVVAGLIAIPARIGAHRPVADILQAEHA
jgi:ABC-type lipoprotein release transport system permease subunit